MTRIEVEPLTEARYRRLCGAVAAVLDPEVPVLTIEDLGILRSVDRVGSEVTVTITPTYSGCPAIQHIEAAILEVLDTPGVVGRVKTAWTPPWTTAWMSDAGRLKLREYGIAPPSENSDFLAARVAIRPSVHCPRCDSANTSRVSQFGSTACKAQYTCRDCLEPFDHFKDL